MKKIKLLLSFYLSLTFFLTSYAANITDVKKNNLTGNDFLENSNGPQCKDVNDESIFTNLPAEFTFKCQMPYALYYLKGKFISYSEWATSLSASHPQAYFYKKVDYNISNLKKSESNCLNLSFNLKQKSNDKNTEGEVTKLQNFLILNNYLTGLRANGHYGQATVKAVKDFQKRNDLIVTGAVGKVTRAKVNDLSCVNKAAVSIKTDQNKKEMLKVDNKIGVKKYNNIEEFLNTKERQSKMVDLYTNLMSEFSCVVDEKDTLPLSLVSNFNNKLFEKKCQIDATSSGEIKFSAERVSRDSVATFFISGAKVTEEKFFEGLQKEIANIGEFPTFLVKKI